MKFKVGDRVRIVKNIWEVETNNKPVGIGEYHFITQADPMKKYPYKLDAHFNLRWCDEELESSPNAEKIVITTDGKTTTATLYRDNEKVTAEAKCSPEDKFDFITGAKLAMHRLVEKTEEVIIDGFKLGERVHYKGHNGTVICFSQSNVGVEFDVNFVADGWPGHDCSGVNLRAGRKSLKDTCHWVRPKELHHGETKYYNGKVVCVANKYNDRIPLPDFTVGKVYEVVDGVIVDDVGWESNNYTDLEKLCHGMGNTFIPLVE